MLRKKLTSIYLEPIEEFGHKVCSKDAKKGAEESEKLAVITLYDMITPQNNKHQMHARGEAKMSADSKICLSVTSGEGNLSSANKSSGLSSATKSTGRRSRKERQNMRKASTSECTNGFYAFAQQAALNQTQAAEI